MEKIQNKIYKIKNEEKEEVSNNQEKRDVFSILMLSIMIILCCISCLILCTLIMISFIENIFFK